MCVDLNSFKMKKHKSGALKRKEQEQRKNLVASCVPLTNFFSATQPFLSGKCLAAASSRQARVSKERAASSVQESNPEEEGEDDDDSGEDEINEDSW